MSAANSGADQIVPPSTEPSETTSLSAPILSYYETKSEEAERLSSEAQSGSNNLKEEITETANDSATVASDPVNSTNQNSTEKNSSKNTKSNFRKSVWRLSQISVLLLIILTGYFLLPGGYDQEKIVQLRSGTNLTQISVELAKEKVIRSDFIFKSALHVPCMLSFGGFCPEYSLKAGEYKFAANLSMMAIARQLLRGDVILHQITIPEGLRVVDVIELVQEQPFLEGKLPPDLPPEGSLLPETYVAERGEQRTLVIKRMRDAMTTQLAKIWSERDGTIPLRSPSELVNLAAIVERETSLPEERPRVAAVYLNRLRRGMRLQADPTVVYAIGLANPNKPLRKVLFTKDLLKPSPYNTYLNLGLPPGPIANPGVNSMLAVAHPLTTNELYFVANGRGGHNFASNLTDHNRNVDAWKKSQGR